MNKDKKRRSVEENPLTDLFALNIRFFSIKALVIMKDFNSNLIILYSDENTSC